MTVGSNLAVLITGAAGGIGIELCRSFLASGYFVVATDKVAAQGLDVPGVIEADLEVLVADEDQAQAFKREVLHRINGRPLVSIINNAAIQILGSAEHLEMVEFRRSLTVNLVAPLLLIKLFFAQLESARASIVNIGSIHSILTKPGFVSYSTSKAGLAGMTRALAVDIGERMRVNCIQPAATNTTMLREGFASNPSLLNQVKSSHPLNRIADPDEIAKTALFLVSDESSFLTGTTINLDGGISSRLHDPA